MFLGQFLWDFLREVADFHSKVKCDSSTQTTSESQVSCILGIVSTMTLIEKICFSVRNDMFLICVSFCFILRMFACFPLKIKLFSIFDTHNSFMHVLVKFHHMLNLIVYKYYLLLTNCCLFLQIVITCKTSLCDIVIDLETVITNFFKT